MDSVVACMENYFFRACRSSVPEGFSSEEKLNSYRLVNALVLRVFDCFLYFASSSLGAYRT